MMRKPAADYCRRFVYVWFGGRVLQPSLSWLESHKESPFSASCQTENQTPLRLASREVLLCAKHRNGSLRRRLGPLPPQNGTRQLTFLHLCFRPVAAGGKLYRGVFIVRNWELRMPIMFSVNPVPLKGLKINPETVVKHTTEVRRPMLLTCRARLVS